MVVGDDGWLMTVIVPTGRDGGVSETEQVFRRARVQNSQI